MVSRTVSYSGKTPQKSRHLQSGTFRGTQGKLFAVSSALPIRLELIHIHHSLALTFVTNTKRSAFTRWIISEHDQKFSNFQLGEWYMPVGICRLFPLFLQTASLQLLLQFLHRHIGWLGTTSKEALPPRFRHFFEQNRFYSKKRQEKLLFPFFSSLSRLVVLRLFLAAIIMLHHTTAAAAVVGGSTVVFFWTE